MRFIFIAWRMPNRLAKAGAHQRNKELYHDPDKKQEYKTWNACVRSFYMQIFSLQRTININRNPDID